MRSEERERERGRGRQRIKRSACKEEEGNQQLPFKPPLPIFMLRQSFEWQMSNQVISIVNCFTSHVPEE
jgi:hypothetical protein